MKPARLRDLLHRLSVPDRLLTLLYVLLLWSRHQLRSLHPSRLVIPAILAQFTLLTLLAILQLTPYFFLGSILLTTLFLLPSTIKSTLSADELPRYHWIGT